MTSDLDPEDTTAPWVTGDYDDPRARLAWLHRQRRIAEGWQVRGPGGPLLPPHRDMHPEPAATMTGDAARDVQELRDWLAYQAAVGALIDAEIFHEDL